MEKLWQLGKEWSFKFKLLLWLIQPLIKDKIRLLMMQTFESVQLMCQEVICFHTLSQDSNFPRNRTVESLVSSFAKQSFNAQPCKRRSETTLYKYNVSVLSFFHLINISALPPGDSHHILKINYSGPVLIPVGLLSLFRRSNKL